MYFHRKQLLRLELFVLLFYFPIITLITILLGNKFNTALYLISFIFGNIHAILCLRYTIPIKAAFFSGKRLAFLAAIVDFSYVAFLNNIDSFEELVMLVTFILVVGFIRYTTLIRIIKFPHRYEVAKPRKKDRKWHEHD